MRSFAAYNSRGNKMKRRLITRSTGKWTDFIPVALVLAYFLVVVGQLIGSGVFALTGAEAKLTAIVGDEDTAKFLLMYFDFFGIWIAFFLATGIFKNNRPMLRPLAFRGDGVNLRGAAVGLLLGFAVNGFCVIMSWILGDIVLSFNGFNPALFFAFLFVVMVQSGAEEIVDRCYLYQKLRRGYKNPWIAIIGNAVAFACLHLLNPGVTAVGIAQIVFLRTSEQRNRLRILCVQARCRVRKKRHFLQCELWRGGQCRRYSRSGPYRCDYGHFGD